MSSQSQQPEDQHDDLDLVWRLLLDQCDGKQHSLSGSAETSNEITTSQLAILFPDAGQKTRQLFDLFWPLVAPDRRDFVVAHLGQSLDGRIAALNGASQWITGPEDVIHNHRMRALADVVVVGAGTVCYDDPQLTVRGIEGRSPTRVVIDPSRRLGENYKVFSDDGVETLLLCRDDLCREDERHGNARMMGIAADDDGGLPPKAVLSALRAAGMQRIFVEGGGMTVSGFLAAGCLDRLQITVAPVILGSGRPSITLPEIEDIADGMRPTVRQFALGDDTLFECCFDGHQPCPR